MCWGGQEPIPRSAGRIGMGWGSLSAVRAGGCSGVAPPWVMAEQLQQSLALAMAKQPCGQCCSLCSGPVGLWAIPQFQRCFPETLSAAFSLLWACRMSRRISICFVQGELLGTRTTLVISVSSPWHTRLWHWMALLLGQWDDDIRGTLVCWQWCCLCA